MKIDVQPVFGKQTDSQLQDTTVIVVDVLRATTSIICALNGGAIKVVPTVDAGDAVALASRLGARECVLGGERGGVQIAGFELGNSPEDYLSRKVRNKTVIISTTNGTGALYSVRSADKVLLAGMINRTAAAKAAACDGNDILIVCAGTEGMPSADDLCTAGAIIEAVRQYADVMPGELTDMAILCETLYKNWKEGSFDMAQTFHYSRLCAMGFDEDVEFCFTPDTTDTVPIYRDGVIQKFN
ncbi:MAG: 2-phosphosulfolactate phosphatase [Clostridia bacterium]|nr:2-phosphosulfolactate phosphatase [Clostridia bacterium]